MRTTLAATMTLAAVLALPALSPAAAQDRNQAQDQRQQNQQQAQAQVPADAHGIIDKKAMSPQGKDVGEVKDVLVGQDGRVAAMVVDHRGKSRAVPWNQVQLQGDQVTIKMSEQQLSQLPEYNAKKD